MKHNKSLQNNNGFTLLEVLLSFTLFFIIAIPLLNYFFQAYQYTSQSQNKTIAVNVARSVLNYLEGQSFYALKVYLNSESNATNLKYIKLDVNDCNKSLNLSFEDPNKLCTESDVNCFNTPLFEFGNDLTSESNNSLNLCEIVFNPKINNEDYGNKISIYLTDYHSNNITESLKNSDPVEVFESSEAKLSDKKLQENLIKTYVIVNWHDKREKIVLEGIISNEALR